MSMFRRIMLFVSSYIPLYIFLILKNIIERIKSWTELWTQFKSAHFFDEINDYAITVLFLLSVFSAAYLLRLTKRTDSSHKYEIRDINEQTGTIYFNYISVYLLSCIGLSLNSTADVFVFCFLMILIGYIYINNQMTYMNPVLQLFHYRIYEGTLFSPSTNKDLKNVIVICPKGIQIEESKKYWGSAGEDFIHITEEDESNN